jgi:hypothetical protein
MGNLKLLNDDSSLYNTDKISYEKSLEFAKSLDQNDDELIFHLFWRVPKDFGLKQATAIKSIITSHISKLDKLQINLWSNVDLTENPYLKEIKKFINFKKWDMREEIIGTVLSDCTFLKDSNSIQDEICYLEGDLFRLLVLHKYGGFYLDMDVLVLRDMSTLNNFEFLYQWGPTGFKCYHSNRIFPEMEVNGAVMRLNKNSELSIEFLEILKKTNPVKNSHIWDKQLYSRTEKNSVLVLPCIWFNSEWGYEGTNNTFAFKNQGDIITFDGAFCWHWHNKWDHEIEEGSKFYILQKEIENKIKLII